jgi:hypothetical protein
MTKTGAGPIVLCAGFKLTFYMVKLISKSIVCLMLFAAPLLVHGQKPSLKLSGGLLYSNIASEAGWLTFVNTPPPSASEAAQPHPWRPGGWATLESCLLSKRLFQLDIGLTYQERPPLEIFPFAAGPQAGVRTTVTVGNWPSTARHPLFNDPAHTFWRFPNFRYLHLEAMPSFKYEGERFSLLAGVGVFGGGCSIERKLPESLTILAKLRQFSVHKEPQATSGIQAQTSAYCQS